MTITKLQQTIILINKEKGFTNIVYSIEPRAEFYTRHEPWSLAPWLTGMIVAVVIFVVLIPAICSAW
jgi:hypothetical protein